ncbi:hypothetical protein BOTBODRAFT_335850 [Botryobasidium botryosum FD-172 SS1]|uniref:Ras-domain-containing protein n=1 Tax=Botryobasidium botryosum (strain FD-172 SS1) TaxID=930990 RepID=A0A067MFN2_BOTB1|nr:hypothetical protein BOTBODRAFT_335850 [Botryobasidium botryosum FD-172 SS1]
MRERVRFDDDMPIYAPPMAQDEATQATPYQRHRTSSNLSHLGRAPDVNGLDAKVVVMGNTGALFPPSLLPVVLIQLTLFALILLFRSLSPSPLSPAGVGKTSLVRRYADATFRSSSATSTTGAFFLTKKLVVDGLKVRLQIWDTAGQERFRSMAPMYYRGANAAILVYDITNAASFEDVKVWLEELKKNSSTDLMIYIVGCKADLTRQRAVTQDYARQALRTWFPPPSPAPPPTPPVQPSTPSSFSYIRPRFISLTSSRTVPVPTIAAIVPPTPQANGIRPSKSSSASAVSTPAKERSAWRILERRWSDDGSREMEEATPEPEPEDNWALGKGIELYEVSSKDDQALFQHLIGSIIQRRDIIESERERRERNSVLLTEPILSWQPGEQELRKNTSYNASSSNNGWSCCSA